MAKEHELFSRIVDRIDDSIVVTAPSGLIRHVNAGALHRFGLPLEQIRQVSVEGMIEGVEHGRSWSEIRQEILERGEFRGSVHFLYNDGTDAICMLNAFRVLDDANEVDSLVLVLNDVSETQRITMELEQRNLEMARMNSELIRSNAELKRVSELKSNFLSIASHELKTPLTSIKGYSEIIIDNMTSAVDGGVYRMIESIARAADRLHKVINNMLDVTRIEQKRLRLNPERLDLSATARDCIEELQQFYTKRGIRFECDFDQDLPLFYGDRMRMQQVFTNLFSNALKYSPDGSEVRVRMFLEDGERFHIIVRDAGIGIDKAEQDRIFDPFYEIGTMFRHSTDSAKFMGGGTGLGLSIVKGIVERHGGRIWVHSSGMDERNFPGSEFHVVLPIEARIQWDDNETKMISTDAIEAQQVRERDEEAPAPPTDEKPKVLLVDDDREAVEICRMVLESAFDIVVAETGESGLRMAFTEKPSLVLLDLYLPGLDGLRICRILKSQDETRDIPVAFFSAGTQNDEVQEAFACGADDYIVKPFSGRELMEKIWRLLMKKKAEDSYR